MNMEDEIRNKESTEGKKREGFIKSLFSGSLISEKIILGNLGYIALLTLIGSIYIANRFHAEKVIRDTDILQKEVKELRSEAMSISADLMYISKQSEVSRMVRQKNLGLNDLSEPPYKLVIKE
jgi:hypothetical protein